MGLYFNIALFLPFNNFEGNLIFVKGYVIERKNEVTESESKFKEYSIRVNTLDELKLLKSIKLKIYTDKKLSLGDEVVLKGIFSQGEVRRNYKGFNYRNYLRQNGIYGIINVQDDYLKVIGKEGNIEIFLMKIKDNINSSLEPYFENECLGFFQSLLFGNKKNLQQETKDLFKDTSISHVLAISGMHVGIVLISFENILKKVSQNKRLNYYFEIMFLLFFYILTGMQVSCFRSMLFNILTIVSDLRHEKNNIVKTVIYTYVILITMNVYNVINIGMYLSFLSSVSIMVFNKFLLKLYEYKFERKKIYYKKINSCVYKFLKSNFIVSVSAQILILPIIIYNFNFFSLNFIISNLFISIFISILLKCGYIIVLIDVLNVFKVRFIIFINKIIANGLSIILEFIFLVLEGIRKVDVLNIVFKTPSVVIVISYYLINLILVSRFNNNPYKNYRYILKFNYKKDIKRLLINIIKNKKIIIFLFILIVLNNIGALFQNKRFKFVFYRCWSRRLYFDKIRHK